MRLERCQVKEKERNEMVDQSGADSRPPTRQSAVKLQGIEDRDFCALEGIAHVLEDKKRDEIDSSKNKVPYSIRA